MMNKVISLQEENRKLEAAKRKLESEASLGAFDTAGEFDVVKAIESLSGVMARYFLSLSCERNNGKVTLARLEQSNQRDISEIYEQLVRCMEHEWLRLGPEEEIILFTDKGWKIVDELRILEVLRFIESPNQDTAARTTAAMIQGHLDISDSEFYQLLGSTKFDGLTGEVASDDGERIVYCLTDAGKVAFARLSVKELSW